MRRAQTRRRGQAYRLQLPVLENLRAVQVALTEVLEALADGQLEPKAAGLMLYGLQQTTAILRISDWDDEWQEDDEDGPGRLHDFPKFEQKFGVPRGVDLECDPDLALQQAEEHSGTPQTAQPGPQSVADATPAIARTRPGHRQSENGRREPTFAELQQQLRAMQEVVRRHPEVRKPAASSAVEDREVPSSA